MDHKKAKRRPGTPYEDGRIRLEEYDLPGRDGRTHVRTVIRHPNAVVVFPIRADGQIVLVRNYRLPTGGTLLELPAGCMDPGETPQEAARRELREETGYVADTLEPLGEFYPAPGLLDEYMYAFAAGDLRLGERELDATEEISVESLTLPELFGAIDSGSVRDGKTIAVSLLWERRNRGPHPSD
ncbi:MAG: NUDIX hydrolase [Myxococcota bacterium]